MLREKGGIKEQYEDSRQNFVIEMEGVLICEKLLGESWKYVKKTADFAPLLRRFRKINVSLSGLLKNPAIVISVEKNQLSEYSFYFSDFFTRWNVDF